MVAISAGRGRTLLVYFVTIFVGYACFIAPNLAFGIFGGGLTGWTLAMVGIIQLVTVVPLVWAALRILGADFGDIGWDWSRTCWDLLAGTAAGLAWALVETLWVIPAHGGAAEPQTAQIIAELDGRLAGLLSYLVLGVVGGGITEEIFNRGFAINVLKSTFASPRIGLIFASAFSILLFMLGHMPSTGLDWVTILVPTLIYTAMFIATGRLAAPMAAHAVHNAAALLVIWFVYVA